MAEIAKDILVPDYLTVRELAELIDSSPIDVMKTLDLKWHHGINQPADRLRYSRDRR